MIIMSALFVSSDRHRSCCCPPHNGQPLFARFCAKLGSSAPQLSSDYFKPVEWPMFLHPPLSGIVVSRNCGKSVVLTLFIRWTTTTQCVSRGLIPPPPHRLIPFTVCARIDKMCRLMYPADSAPSLTVCSIYRIVWKALIGPRAQRMFGMSWTLVQTKL